MKGSLKINEVGEPVFTPQRSESKESIKLREPIGADLMEMSRGKNVDNYTQLLRIIASLSGKHTKYFANMHHKDVQVLKNLVTLFLA